MFSYNLSILYLFIYFIESGSKALDNLKTDSNSENSENLNRRNVFDRIHTLLIRLINLVPTLPSILQPIIIRHFPHKRESKIQQMTYIKNLLTIINYCPSLGDEILGLIVDRTIQIDVITIIFCHENM